MASEDFPAPSEGFVATHFIVAADVARSRDFYTGVLGARDWSPSRIMERACGAEPGTAPHLGRAARSGSRKG